MHNVLVNKCINYNCDNDVDCVRILIEGIISSMADSRSCIGSFLIAITSATLPAIAMIKPPIAFQAVKCNRNVNMYVKILRSIRHVEFLPI